MDLSDRIIGRFGLGIKGPLLVTIGAMHGNEPAGVEAIKKSLYWLHHQQAYNNHFTFRGSFIGIIGNLDALNQQIRYVTKDLNRSWSYDAYKELKELEYENMNSEQKQIYEIIEAIRSEINKSSPRQIIVLDLHTTSSFGGIFSLTTDDPFSRKMAKEFHAPVIEGMLQGVEGSSIHFFHGQNMGIPTTAIAFECGQHQEPESAERGKAVIINCLKTIGCINQDSIDTNYDNIIKHYSAHLPKVCQIVDKYKIKNNDFFSMLPGFKNFDPIQKGQLLAHDIDGEVRSKIDARILMPFYQKKGEEGFFVIKEIE